jgi:TetR/AcrR family transcriptional regulator, repressor for neighboring sulfatase
MPRPTGDAARGREAVESALLEAASDLLAELGPRATTVRDIASRAGVNHAQVHHYFGGKRALLCEAMAQMARRHYDALRAISAGPVPPPLTLPEDQRYWWAVVRATIEGDLELAGMEVTSGASVIGDVVEHVMQRFGMDRPTVELKAAMAELAAMQLGWLTMERFIFMVVGVEPEEEEAVRTQVRRSVSQRRLQAPDGGPFVSPRQS